MIKSGNPCLLDLSAQSRAIAAGALDPADLTEQLLARIAALDPMLNSFVTVLAETARREAAAARLRAQAGERRGPLDGIAVALKDNIDIAGLPTGNGFARPDGAAAWRLPRRDAEVVRRLRAAGAVILGKLNMHEGALGATSDNPHHGPVINPHRLGFTPGGSSGGSGAAVAAALCGAALGTDTGGSVRIPASYCGVVGFKPSYGLISTRGVVPLSWRLDHVGPLTRSVADARVMLAGLQGFDPACPESRRVLPGIAPPIAGLRVGVLTNFAAESCDDGVADGFAAALRVLRELGCAVGEITLPSFDPAQGRRAALLRIEADAALCHGELYRSAPEHFSPALRGLLDFGARMSAVQLAGAERVIDSAAAELTLAFAEVDAIVSPTTPQAGFALGTQPPVNQNAFSILANFAGCPAISVPMGRTADGMPLGLQIIAPVGGDALALNLAEAYETAAQWRIAPPPPFSQADRAEIASGPG